MRQSQINSCLFFAHINGIFQMHNGFFIIMQRISRIHKLPAQNKLIQRTFIHRLLWQLLSARCGNIHYLHTGNSLFIRRKLSAALRTEKIFLRHSRAAFRTKLKHKNSLLSLIYSATGLHHTD